MSETTACVAARCHPDSAYCSRFDLLVGLEGLHVVCVQRDDDVGVLRVVVESQPGPMGCHTCGVVAHSHGHPAVQPYRDALADDGIPIAQFAVDDVAAEHLRLTGLGVVFTQPPTDIGTAVIAVLDDTCGKPHPNHHGDTRRSGPRPLLELARRPTGKSGRRLAVDRL